MTTENSALMEALEPFAKCCDQIADSEPDDEWAKFRLTIGDYRRAKAAMEALSRPTQSSGEATTLEPEAVKAEVYDILLEKVRKAGFPYLQDAVNAAIATHPAPLPADAVALEAYRAAVRWIASDSWDGCSDCIRLLQMARSVDDFDWSPDDHAAALKRLYERAGQHPLPAEREAGGEGVDQAKSQAMDEAADFCIQTLAKALGVDDWQQADGSEEWQGDVAGTIYNVLRVGRVYDDEDGRVARLEDAQPVSEQGEGREGPAPIPNTRLQCFGCKNLHTEDWSEPSGDGETFDNGTTARCKAVPTEHGGEVIRSYWSRTDEAPKWCPFLPAAPQTDGGKA